MYTSIYFDQFIYGMFIRAMFEKKPTDSFFFFFCLHHNVVSLIFIVKGAYKCLHGPSLGLATAIGYQHSRLHPSPTFSISSHSS